MPPAATGQSSPWEGLTTAMDRGGGERGYPVRVRTSAEGGRVARDWVVRPSRGQQRGCECMLGVVHRANPNGPLLDPTWEQLP